MNVPTSQAARYRPPLKNQSSPPPPASNGQSSADRHKQLVHGAQVFVSQTFFGQMLKQMRDSPFRSELFDGGRGGQMFSALLDQRLADRMARGVGDKLVMSIVNRIEGRPTVSSPPGPRALSAASAGGARAALLPTTRSHDVYDIRA